MRIQFKTLQRAVAALALAIVGLVSVGNSSAYALNDDFLFGYTFGDGAQTLVLNDGEYTIQATTLGWVDNLGNNNNGGGNYIVGDCNNCGNLNFRNYFAFDLAGVTSTITSAYLSLYNPAIGFTGNDKTFLVHDLTFAGNSVLDLTTGGIELYNAIGLANVVGSTFVTSSSNDSNVIVNLNAIAIAGLNDSLGEIVAGGGTIAVSAVPLPAALPMFGFAVAGLFGAARRKKIA